MSRTTPTNPSSRQTASATATATQVFPSSPPRPEEQPAFLGKSKKMISASLIHRNGGITSRSNPRTPRARGTDLWIFLCASFARALHARARNGKETPLRRRAAGAEENREPESSQIARAKIQLKGAVYADDRFHFQPALPLCVSRFAHGSIVVPPRRHQCDDHPAAPMAPTCAPTHWRRRSTPRG